MAVGTGAISLQEVATELGLDSTTNLIACFNNANPAGFDPTYAIPDEQSLSEFRGYDLAAETLTTDPANLSTTILGALNGRSVTVTVTSNTSWNVINLDSATWLSFIPTSATGNGSFTITADTNLNPPPSRSARIRVVTSTLTSTLLIEQEGNA